jgi:hypothetical protein
MIIKRLCHGKDLISEIERVFEDERIKTGWFIVIGALKNVTYGFYDQSSKKYMKSSFDEECEITSCTGNVSILENKIFVHAHINFADKYGNVKGGHLFSGEIFAAEILFFDYKEILIREFDKETNLKLWKI